MKCMIAYYNSIDILAMRDIETFCLSLKFPAQGFELNTKAAFLYFFNMAIFSILWGTCTEVFFSVFLKKLPCFRLL